MSSSRLLAVLAVAAAALPLAACAFTDIKTEPLGHNRYLIQGHGNAYTSTAEVAAEVHRTATRLCPTGYDVDDSQAGVKSDEAQDLFGSGTHTDSRPSGAAVVTCRATPTEQRAEFARAYDRQVLDLGARAHAAGADNELLVIVSPRCGTGLLAALTDLSAVRAVDFKRLDCTSTPGGAALESVDLWVPRTATAASPLAPLE